MMSNLQVGSVCHSGWSGIFPASEGFPIPKHRAQARFVCGNDSQLNADISPAIHETLH
jgi:hypothetical protein